MNDVNWYRKTNWTKLDKEEFFTRLGRCRSQASQYARIQADALLNSDKPELIPEAIEIFNYVLIKWPDAFDLGLVYFGLAKCYEKLDDLAKTVEYYHLVLELEERRPYSKTLAAENFGLFVAQNKLRRYYGEIDILLTKRRSDFVFPLSQFIVYTALALINADLSEKTNAKVFAKIALAESKKIDSGFRYHKKLGLVGDKEKNIMTELKRLV